MVDSGTRIFDKYVLRECIGSGAFGEVWNADSVSTGELVAVKMERIQGNPAPTLQYESRVLQLLQGVPGIPRLRYFGRKDEMNRIFMVTEMLGPSLETLANSHRFDMSPHKPKHTPPTHVDFISAVGRQMLQRLRSVHARGMLHRDVKPDNFLFARSPVLDMSKRATRSNQASLPMLYLIDFGMAKRIKQPIDNHGESARASGSLIGSVRYASTAAHVGAPLGKKDDLISMMYSLIYLANGGALPWMNYVENEIYYIKNDMTPTELCSELSERHADGWSHILDELYAMNANAIPNYDDIEHHI
jgi:serine/threonine protein kinase